MKSINYRPEIDGLRSIAVLAVILIILTVSVLFYFSYDNDKIIMDNNDWIELIDFFDQILNKEGKIILGLGPPYYIEIPEVLKNWAYFDDKVTQMGQTFLKTGLLE